MISINGKTFCLASLPSKERDSEHIHGTYRTYGRNIHLFDKLGERIGGINRHEVLYGSTRIGGKLWHSYAKPKGIPEYDSYSSGVEEVRAIMRQVFGK